MKKKKLDFVSNINCYNYTCKYKTNKMCGGIQSTHTVWAEVTYVIATDEQSDHFPVVVKINALKKKAGKCLAGLC